MIPTPGASTVSLLPTDVPRRRMEASLRDAPAPVDGFVSGAITFGRALRKDASAQRWLHDEQEALVHAYLTAPAGMTPSLEGVERADIVRDVQAVEAQGISMLKMDRADVDILSAFEAWRTLAHPHATIVLGLCNAPFAGADAEHLPAVAAPSAGYGCRSAAEASPKARRQRRGSRRQDARRERMATCRQQGHV